MRNMDNLETLQSLLLKEAPKYKSMPIALSGGIDSSLLAAIIKPKFAMSVDVPGGDKYGEINYAKRVALELGIDHLIVVPDDSEFDECMEKAVKAIRRPIPHFNIFPLFCMFRELSNLGETDLIQQTIPIQDTINVANRLIINNATKTGNSQINRRKTLD